MYEFRLYRHGDDSIMSVERISVGDGASVTVCRGDRRECDRYIATHTANSPVTAADALREQKRIGIID